MVTEGHQLGIDFGTSNTVAVLRWPDRRVRPLLFDGVPLLPSAVFVDEEQTLVGREALHAARTRPEAFEPNPKRRIDDGTVLLASRELTIVQLFAAVLRRVLAEATRVTPRLAATTLTCPAAWGPRRRAVLLEAARTAGIPAPRLVDEPIAAASYFAEVQAARVPPGALAVVYDFGAGTFDASVVRNGPNGFEVLASEGLPDAGGLDVDAAIVRYFGSQYAGRDTTSWQRLQHPQTSTDRRVSRLLWDDVRAAKETLSRTSTTLVPIPLLDEDAPLGREQLEELCRPILNRTVAATLDTLRTARVSSGDIAEVYLVGGSSRIPLAATLLHQALGVAPTAIEQPEMVVAEGSLFATGSTAPVEQFDPPISAVAVRGVSAVPPSPPPSPPPAGPVSPAAAMLVSGPPAHFPMSVPPAATPISGPPAPPHSAPPASVPPHSAPPASVPPHSAPPHSAPPASVPPASPPAPGSQVNYAVMLGIGAAVAAVVVAALIGSSEWARAVFGIGVRAPLVYPAVILIPAALVLLLGVRRDQTRSDLGVLARTAALMVAGYAAALSLSLPLALDIDAARQPLDITAMLLGLGAGTGLAIFGIRRAIRAPARAHGPLPPILAGAGFAASSLPDLNLGIPLPRAVLDSTFRWATVPDGIGLYAAFLIGFTLIVATAVLAVALARGAGPFAGAAGSRGTSLAGGILLALGGGFVAYASAVGMLFVIASDTVYRLNLTAFLAAEPYSWFADALELPVTPWLVIIAFVALLVAMIVRHRAARRARA